MHMHTATSESTTESTNDLSWRNSLCSAVVSRLQRLLACARAWYQSSAISVTFRTLSRVSRGDLWKVPREGTFNSTVRPSKGRCSPVADGWREGVRTPGLLWSYSGPELSGTPAGVHSGALRPGVLTPLRGCVRMNLIRSGARRLRPNFAPGHPGPLRGTTPSSSP